MLHRLHSAFRAPGGPASPLRRILVRWLAAVSLLPGFLAVVAQAQRGIPVLVYHRFDPSAPASTTVTVGTLASQLRFLDEHGYRVVPLRTVVAAMQRGAALPASPTVAITVDDGHRSVYTLLYPIILKRHMPVTLFIYPSAISRSSWALTWEQLREMKASGLVDIQSHTYWHPDFRREKRHRTPADYAAFVDMQLQRSRTRLEQELGGRVDLLAWPYGIVDRELEAAAQRAGYAAAFGYDGALAGSGDDLFAIHRIPVPDTAREAAFGTLLHGRRGGSPEEGHASSH